MKRIAILCLLALAGCDEKPITTADAGNPTVNGAQLIARVDGCNIWRIYYGRSVFFARCPEGSRLTQWEERSGKTSHTMFTLGDN